MDLFNLIIEKLSEYLNSVNWPVAFTCVIVNYLFAKGSDSIQNLKWQTAIGWISKFWRAMAVSIIIGFIFWKTTEAEKISIVNGVIWSHIIYEGAIKYLKEKFGL